MKGFRAIRWTPALSYSVFTSAFVFDHNYGNCTASAMGSEIVRRDWSKNEGVDLDFKKLAQSKLRLATL